MNTKRLVTARTSALAALLLAVVFGAPSLAQADQGKWWTPKEGDRTPVADRQGSGWVRPGPGRFQGNFPGRGHAISRPWRSGPVIRDYVSVRHGHRGRFHRARRIYIEPYYNRHFVYVRPVRLYFSAAARIGPVDIHVQPYGHRDFLYGCNFCDARFEGFRGYSRHLYRCDARPHGYEVRARDWEESDRFEEWPD